MTDLGGQGKSTKSKLRCYGGGKSSHIKTDGKYKAEDLKEKKATIHQMTMQAGRGAGDSHDENYAITGTICFMHSQIGYKTDQLLNSNNENIGSVVTHSFNKNS